MFIRTAFLILVSVLLNHASGENSLGISIVNTGPGVNVYITGSDSDNNAMILQPNGQWYHAPSEISTTPVSISSDLITIPSQGLDQSTDIFISTDVNAGRIWLAEGNLNFSFVISGTGQASIVEPSINDFSSIGWGFLEFTYNTNTGLWADISNVDFVGIPLGLSISSLEDRDLQVGGLQYDAVQGICDALKIQSMVDGYPWGDLCVGDSYGNPLSVLSPNTYMQRQPAAFSNYWACYIDNVWSKYSSETLVINTQSSELGDALCTVENEFLTCSTGMNLAEQMSTSMMKPSSGDVFSCNTGPFTISTTTDDLQKTIIPRLCAAFHRSTLLASNGNIQPNGPQSTTYYSSNDTTNWYSKLVHQWEVNGQGYAFPYDDVTSNGDLSEGKSQSGLLFSNAPQNLTVYVGGNPKL
jgi:hypothetical protein